MFHRRMTVAVTALGCVVAATALPAAVAGGDEYPLGQYRSELAAVAVMEAGWRHQTPDVRYGLRPDGTGVCGTDAQCVLWAREVR